MDWLALKLVSWLIHAIVVMVSVGAVSKGNPRNTLPRALLVTLMVAVVVTPFAWFWFLIIPGIIAAFLLSLSLSIDDYIITSFVAGDVSTLPRKIFDSAKVQIPPQVHVLATMIMIVAVLILVVGTIVTNRRRQA